MSTTDKTLNFDDVIGKEFSFYGAAEHQFKLGKTVWEALEDECDGYRSYLGSVEAKASTAIFFKRPIAKVRVVKEDEDTYKLIDIADNHCWLEFGTDHTDSYYPWFVFNYQPKEAKREYMEGR